MIGIKVKGEKTMRRMLLLVVLLCVVLVPGLTLAGNIEFSAPAVSYTDAVDPVKFGTVQIPAKKGFSWYTDFLGLFGSSGGRGELYYSYVSGTGAVCNTPGALINTNDMGVGYCRTGTNAAGYAGIWAGGGIAFGNSTILWAGRTWVTALSDDTDTYTYWTGFGNTASGTQPVHGLYFRYTHGENSGRWVCVARANSAETTQNSTVTLAPNTAYALAIKVTDTTAEFYVNGSRVCDGTGLVLPSGVAQATGLNTAIAKSVGTATREIDLDYAYLGALFDVER